MSACEMSPNESTWKRAAEKLHQLFPLSVCRATSERGEAEFIRAPARMEGRHEDRNNYRALTAPETSHLQWMKSHSHNKSTLLWRCRENDQEATIQPAQAQESINRQEGTLWLTLSFSFHINQTHLQRHQRRQRQAWTPLIHSSSSSSSVFISSKLSSYLFKLPEAVHLDRRAFVRFTAREICTDGKTMRIRSNAKTLSFRRYLKLIVFP